MLQCFTVLTFSSDCSLGTRVSSALIIMCSVIGVSSSLHVFPKRYAHPISIYRLSQATWIYKNFHSVLLWKNFVDHSQNDSIDPCRPTLSTTLTDAGSQTTGPACESNRQHFSQHENNFLSKLSSPERSTIMWSKKFLLKDPSRVRKH